MDIQCYREGIWGMLERPRILPEGEGIDGAGIYSTRRGGLQERSRIQNTTVAGMCYPGKKLCGLNL